MMWVLVISIGILLVLALLALAAGLRASARYRRACRYVRGLFSELDEPLPADIGAMDLEGLLKNGYERIVAQLVRPSNDQIMKFKTLQNQVNPHFLYNTLESIRAVALCDGEKGLPQIAAMTEALARYFRYNISNRNDMVSLDEEMNNIEQYMMIQRFRFSDRFELQILYQNCDASVRGFMHWTIP